MKTIFIVYALAMLLQVAISFEKADKAIAAAATNIDGADVYVEDPNGFKVQYLLADPDVIHAVQQLVKVSRDSRSIDWIYDNNGGGGAAKSFKIKITITCCKPFKITVEF
jgi:hypothetical protein